MYKWITGFFVMLAGVFTIKLQRNKINNQAETIKDSQKVINVKTAVSDTNKKSEIEARENVNEITKNDDSMRDYLVNGKLRDHKD